MIRARVSIQSRQSRSTEVPQTRTGGIGLGISVSLALHLVLISGVFFVFGSQRKIQPLPVPIQVSVSIESGSSASTKSLPRVSVATRTKQSEASALAPPPQEKPERDTNPSSTSPVIGEASPASGEVSPPVGSQTDASDATAPVPSPIATTSNEAPSGLVSTQAPDNEPSEGGDTEKALIAAYQSRLSRLIDAAKLYPRVAREQGLEGRAGVFFSLTKDGSFLTPPRIETSSGFRQLDQAALNAVRSAVTSPQNSFGSLKFDPRMNAESLDFRISIVFTLQ